MNPEIYEYITADRRSAWKVFRYICNNPELLKQAYYKKIYDNVRTITILHHLRNSDKSFDEVGEIVDFLADLKYKDDNKKEPSPALYEHYQKHSNIEYKMKALIICTEWNFDE